MASPPPCWGSSSSSSTPPLPFPDSRPPTTNCHLTPGSPSQVHNCYSILVIIFNYLKSPCGQVPHVTNPFYLVARTNKSIFGGNIPNFPKRKNLNTKNMLQYIKNQRTVPRFRILFFVFEKVVIFIPRGIKMLFYRNPIKKLFTARRLNSFFGKFHTNIFAKFR